MGSLQFVLQQSRVNFIEILSLLYLVSLVAQTVENLSAVQTPGFDLWVRKIPWRRAWLPTPLFLLGEFREQRSLVGYSPWDCKESDTTG